VTSEDQFCPVTDHNLNIYVLGAQTALIQMQNKAMFKKETAHFVPISSWISDDFGMIF